MTRQIILDTETTGLDPKQGHRLIEIGGIELVNRRFTQKNFHFYLNPERPVDQEALSVHGLNDAFLADKPKFHEVIEKLLGYLHGAELIIHNASFDIGFLNHELQLATAKIQDLRKICTVTDTLLMARQMHPGQKNSLDALSKRYKINVQRTLHGALLDAEILARVYLAMTGGQSSLLDDDGMGQAKAQEIESQKATSVNADLEFMVYLAQPEELAAHEIFLEFLDKKSQNACIWRRE